MTAADPYYGRALFSLLVLVVFTGRVFSASAGGADGSLQIAVERNGLTVKGRDLPLAKVLQEVARQTAVRIEGRLPVADEHITIEFHGLTVEEGIERILAGYNYAFVFSAEKEGDRSSPHRLSEVWIFSKSEQGIPRREMEAEQGAEPISFPDSEGRMEEPLIEEEVLLQESGEDAASSMQSAFSLEEGAIVEELPQEKGQKAVSSAEAGEIPEVDDLGEISEASAVSADESGYQEVEEKEGPF